MNLRGALALVTGASSGIGAATADGLAARGARLLLVGRDTARLEARAAALDAEVRIVDLSVRQQVRALADTLTGPGLPDLVVHNAGAGMVRRAADPLGEELQRLFELNVFAPMVLSSAVLPEMVRRGSGHLLFVTSIAAHGGVRNESAYAATKAALGAYAGSLHGELAGTGVRVTTVVPGVVSTEFFDRQGAPYTRRFPAPIRPGDAAARIIRAVERDRAEVVVPRWLRLALVTRAVAPQTYSRLADRWG